MFDLATNIHSGFAEPPLFSRVLGPADRRIPIVEKKKPRAPSRHQRRNEKDRLVRFEQAAAFAYAMDWPINHGITIAWDALLRTGEHNEGHCLTRDDAYRSQYLRSELARLCRSLGIPFAAFWGRDVGKMMGTHDHVGMFIPTYHRNQLVALIERITGSTADFVIAGYAADTVARSVCGGWQIEVNNWGKEGDKASALRWAEYIAAQHAKHPAPPDLKGKAFGISEAINKAAQERARPMLKAREAQFGWIRGDVAQDVTAARLLHPEGNDDDDNSGG